jgi:hypothetical protein
MGFAANVGRHMFPEQGSLLGKSVRVAFRYNLADTVAGVVVRDDVQEPFRTIIRLDDGRHVLGTECQFAEGLSS